MKVDLIDLGCPNCAMKMESEISKLSNVESVEISFFNQILEYELVNPKEEKKTLNEMQRIITAIEPDCKINVKEEEKRGLSLDEITLFSSILLFAISFFLKGRPQLIVQIAALILSGYKVFRNAVKNLFTLRFLDENFLMSIACLGAIAVGEFQEGIAVMVFYSIGEYFQDLAVDRSRRSIESLIEMKPEYGNLIVGDELRKLKPELLVVGDKIRILPGEKVPVDSVVTEGFSELDTSMITGESNPVAVKEGSRLLNGTINLNGVLTAEVVREASESTVAKILEQVENSQSNKAKSETFIRSFAKWYTPVVVGFALFLFLFMPLVTDLGYSVWFHRALLFLVISCPCALVLSVPLTYFASIGNLAKHHVLLKGSNYLETMAKVDTFAFDKTGTLTTGEFVISKVNGPEDVVEIAARLEENSNHPLAKAFHSVHPKIGPATEVSEFPGRGLEGRLDGHLYHLGNLEWMKEQGVFVEEVQTADNVLYLSKDENYYGSVELYDEPKADAKEMIQELREQGIRRLVLVSGDRKLANQKVAEELGLDDYYAELLPQEKTQVIEKLQRDGVVAFVGDGMNDAPVLTQADVGISMGETGSHAAIESSDVTILGESMKKLNTLLASSHKTNRIVKQNIIFALAVKVLCMVLGTFGLINMWGAVFADVGVAILAVLNAMRMLRFQLNGR